MTIGSVPTVSVPPYKGGQGGHITGDQPSSTTDTLNEKRVLPPIVVRDGFGQILDTDTQYQRDINHARWKVANRTRATEIGPEEWRLPHGPLPARPDFSRYGPSRVATQEILQRTREIRKRSNSLPDLLDAVEGSIRKEYKDLGSSLEKLYLLPPLTAAALFRQTFEQLPNRRYISVAQAYLDGKSADDLHVDTKKLSKDIFPGFSYGYKRAGLCYGCDKGPGPHIHKDIPVRTGGGFTYYKRDFPHGVDPKKNPLHWKFSQLPSYSSLFDDAKAIHDDAGDTSFIDRWLHDDFKTELPRFYLAPDGDELDIDSGRGYSLIDGEDTFRSDETSRMRGASKRVHTRLPILAENGSPDDYEGGLKRGKLFKAPKAFRPGPSKRGATVGKSPFSTNRKLDVNKSDGMKIKKSEKKPTGFIDRPDRPDILWKEPDKFELQDREKVPIQPWTKPESAKSPRERQERSRPASRDSGVEVQDAFKGGDDGTSGGLIPRSPSPVPVVEEKPKEKPPKVEVEAPAPPAPPAPPPVKQPPKRGQQKTRVLEVRQKVEIKEPEPEPEPPQEEEREPTPAPPAPQVEEEDDERVDDDDESDYDRMELPPLPNLTPPEPPMLSEWKEPELSQREISQTEVEVPPPMPEPPGQRQAVTTQRIRNKASYKTRRLKPSVAPITRKDLREIKDPLDYLAKYCIIHPDRLPLYDYVFKDVTNHQPYRYSEVPVPPAEPSTARSQDGAHFGAVKGGHTSGSSPESGVADMDGSPKNYLTQHESRMIKEFTLVNRSLTEDVGMGMSKGEEMVSKLNYTLETMMDKYDHLQGKLHQLQAVRVQQIADLARKTFPEVAKPGYQPVVKKKKKKKKASQKDGKGVTFNDRHVSGSVPKQDTSDVPEDDVTPSAKLREPTDIDIVNRLDQKQMSRMMHHSSMQHLNLEIDRMQQRLRETDDRIDDLEDEKRLMQLYSRDEYITAQNSNEQPVEFKRQQSNLYQKLHPQIDIEMNLNELEEALQQINGHLISEKELQFVYHILDLPGRRRINLKMFSVVAALSEKVAQVEPLVKKLIHKFDFEALSVKMDKCKELFYLLNEQDDNVPDGMVTVRSLIVELMAGGVSPENIEYVLGKFNREKKGVIDFLDFLTYVPLFIEIHGRIIKDPLNEERVL